MVKIADKLNRELLNLADYSKKDVVRYLLNNYRRLERWANMGDSIALDILIDLKSCLTHECLDDKMRYILIDFYVDQHNLTELAEKYKMTNKGVEYWINGGVDRVYKLLNGEIKLY